MRNGLPQLVAPLMVFTHEIRKQIEKSTVENPSRYIYKSPLSSLGLLLSPDIKTTGNS